MADEFDPILEARLRGVLREEAASVPFTLRADTVRRVQAERRRARNMQRLTLMSAAAVVVVAVAGAFLTLNLRNSANVATSPSPSASQSAAPTPDASGLATFEGLRAGLAANGVPNPPISAEHPVAEVGVGSKTWIAGTVGPSEIVLVAISCSGGDITVGIVAGEQHLTAGTTSCGTMAIVAIDGTLAGPGGNGQVVVEAAPSVRWRLVAGGRDAVVSSGSPSALVQPSTRSSGDPVAHPKPTVACQPEPKDQSVPPGISLYQGSNELGVGQYYTFTWGSTSSDGAPVVGDHILDGGDGTGLVVRIAGDTCAIAWQSMFGSGTSGNVGYDKVGDLAQQRNPSGDPAFAQENRIALGNLPAGDWVVEVQVRFVNGDGSAIFLVHVAGAAAASSTAPAASFEPPAAGQIVLATMHVTAGTGTGAWTGVRPAGTDKYRVEAACTGEGTVLLTVDGVSGLWDCRAIGVQEFAAGPDQTASMKATAVGNAQVSLRLSAWDQAKTEFWDPPTLSLSGPDWTAGDTSTVRGTAGCGSTWEPRDGQGGYTEDCGPSWLAAAWPLHQRSGTLIAISLPSGWTISAVTASIARSSEILPSRAPQEQPVTVTKVDGAWMLDVPGAGDWGVRLYVAASMDGDQMAVPYYSRIIVEP